MSLADVSYTTHDDRWTLAFVRELRHPPERVWEALTRAEELAGWAPFTADRDLTATGPATLTMIDGDSRVDLPGEVIRVQPPVLLEYAWGEDRLRWELADAAGGGTRLTLHHTVSDEDMLAKAAAGWDLCLDVAERRLGGEDAAPIRGRDALDHGWQERYVAYASALSAGEPA